MSATLLRGSRRIHRAWWVAVVAFVALVAAGSFRAAPSVLSGRLG